MEKEFWKTSASFLHEKAVPQRPEKQAAQAKRKKPNKEQDFQSIRQLENAYGKYVFGANKDRYVVKISRKSEYHEDTFDQSREELNEDRWTIVNKKDTIFKYIFWERLDYLPIPECCFHFIWCQIA